MSKDFKKKYFERKFMENFEKKYPYADKMITPRVPYEIGYDDAISDLFPIINEMREALEKCNYHDMNCSKEFIPEGRPCGCPAYEVKPALKNLYEFVGGGE